MIIENMIISICKQNIKWHMIDNIIEWREKL